MKVQYAHIQDRNVGDQAAAVSNYYRLQPVDEIPEKQDFRTLDLQKGVPLIVGGGGMLYPGVDSWIEYATRICPVIVWGIGSNYYEDIDNRERRAVGILKKCKLVGLRHKRLGQDHGFEYVPCPSCHLITDSILQTQKSQSIGIYEHQWKKLNLHGPKLSNYSPTTIEEALKFIASSKRVITSSYHGAYWSQLLGVPYELKKAKSTRFLEIPSEAAEACKALNKQFYEKVKKVVEEYQ